MNEIESIVKGLDMIENTLDIEDEMMIKDNKLRDVYIMEEDINNLKKYLKIAVKQLDNKQIKIKQEE